MHLSSLVIGDELLRKLQNMQTLVDDEDDVPSTSNPSKAFSAIHVDMQPAQALLWMVVPAPTSIGKNTHCL